MQWITAVEDFVEDTAVYPCESKSGDPSFEVLLAGGVVKTGGPVGNVVGGNVVKDGEVNGR